MCPCPRIDALDCISTREGWSADEYQEALAAGERGCDCLCHDEENGGEG